MNLTQRIKKLELYRSRKAVAAVSGAVEDLKRQFAEMTDEELDALIAEDASEPSDPELKAQLARLDDDELCRLILEAEALENDPSLLPSPLFRKTLGKGNNNESASAN